MTNPVERYLASAERGIFDDIRDTGPGFVAEVCEVHKLVGCQQCPPGSVFVGHPGHPGCAHPMVQTPVASLEQPLTAQLALLQCCGTGCRKTWTLTDIAKDPAIVHDITRYLGGLDRLLAVIRVGCNTVIERWEGVVTQEKITAAAVVDPGEQLEVISLLRDFSAIMGACRYGQHGDCQEHGWTRIDPICPAARVRALLALLDMG